MPSFKTHFISGLFLYPIFYFLFLLVYPIFIKSPLSLETSIYGFLIFVFSSDAPDIDYQNGYIRRICKLIVSFFFTAVFFHAISDFYFGKKSIDTFSLILPAFFLISVVSGFLLVAFLFKLIPNHRGPLHTFKASVVYSIVICFFSWSFGERFSMEENSILNSFYLGLCGLTGYDLHLLLDIRIKIKRK